jgi:hypothetical protein
MYRESPPLTIVIHAAPKHLGGGLTDNGLPSADNMLDSPSIFSLSRLRFKIRIIAIDRPSPDPCQDHRRHDHKWSQSLLSCNLYNGPSGETSCHVGTDHGKKLDWGGPEPRGRGYSVVSPSLLVERPNSTFERRSYGRRPIIATGTTMSLSNSQ